MRLNTPKIKFMRTPKLNNWISKLLPLITGNLIINAIKTALKKLAHGPAIATHNISFLGFFKFRKFIGTGLAQPMGGNLNITIVNGRRIVPIGSMWASGLRDNLPEYLAVGSPNLYATQPCAYSCNVIAIRRIIS